MKEFTERNLGVLLNLEFGHRQGGYRAQASLIGRNAMDAIDALGRIRHAEEEGRTPPVVTLADRAELVYRSIHALSYLDLVKCLPESPDSRSTPNRACASPTRLL